MTMEAKYKRVIIKLSGEALAGEIGYGLESNTLNTLAEQIAEISALGVEVACVVGGGQHLARASLAQSAALIVPRQTTWACWQR